EVRRASLRYLNRARPDGLVRFSAVRGWWLPLFDPYLLRPSLRLRGNRAVPTGLVAFFRTSPGTAVPGFHMPPLRGCATPHYQTPNRPTLLFFVRVVQFFGRGLHDVVGARSFDAVLIRIVIDHGHLVPEVIVGWRSRRTALERSSLPRIVIGSVRAPEPAMDEIVEENELGKTCDQRSDCDELMHRDQWDQVIVGKSLVAADVAGNSEVVERHKNAIGSDETQDEVGLAQSFVHHAPSHLREPEVSSGEDSEHGGYSHD